MTSTSPASMGGPLSEADRLSALLVHASEVIWAALGHTEPFGDQEEARTFDSTWKYLGDAVKATSNGEALLDARGEELEGQLATARALHQRERRYTPDDGESSYATYAEAADASFDGTGRPAMVTFFEVCSHCGSIEMAEGCDHQYKESLWPCEDAVALGLDGGDPDAR